ncbi:MAG: TetR/AcrR family transcriptional regulator [Bacteroidota bacterium]|nr:TetR/AcrR family transcriptional regulator [Bacteroidota bacterium]
MVIAKLYLIKLLMMSVSHVFKQTWIEKGYEHFALYGPKNLSINKLSKEIGSSRASFYNHFGDIENFTEELLDMHWQIHQRFCSFGALECKKLFPDLYLLLEQYPIPLKFSRQLFLNRNNPAYNYLFAKTYNASARAFICKLFSEQFGLHQNDEDTNNLWLTVGESWYSRLDPNNLSAEKMQKLAEEIMNSVLKFLSSGLYSKMQKS